MKMVCTGVGRQASRSAAKKARMCKKRSVRLATSRWRESGHRGRRAVRLTGYSRSTSSKRAGEYHRNIEYSKWRYPRQREMDKRIRFACVCVNVENRRRGRFQRVVWSVGGISGIEDSEGSKLKV